MSSRATPIAAGQPALLLLYRLRMFSSANHLLKPPGYNFSHDQTSTATNVGLKMAPVGFQLYRLLTMTTISDQSAVYSTVPHHLALSETPRGVGTKDQVIFVVETRGKKSLICCVEFVTGQKHLSAQN